MKHALLRALRWGLFAGAIAFIAGNLLNYPIDEDFWWHFSRDLEVFCIFAIVVGMEFACLGYFTCPTAKVPAVRSSGARFLGRVFIGAVYGIIPAVIFLIGSGLTCVLLDIRIDLGRPSRSNPGYLAEFTIWAGIAGSFGAAWKAATGAENNYEVRKHFWSMLGYSCVGIVAGIGQGIGTAWTARYLSLLHNADPEFSMWLAALSGLAAGIVAVIFLRMLRAPEAP